MTSGPAGRRSPVRRPRKSAPSTATSSAVTSVAESVMARAGSAVEVVSSRAFRRSATGMSSAPGCPWGRRKRPSGVASSTAWMVRHTEKSSAVARKLPRLPRPSSPTSFPVRRTLPRASSRESREKFTLSTSGGSRAMPWSAKAEGSSARRARAASSTSVGTSAQARPASARSVRRQKAPTRRDAVFMFCPPVRRGDLPGRGRARGLVPCRGAW